MNETNIQPIKLKNIYACLVFALIVRITWSFFVPIAPISDSQMYQTLAISLLNGNGFAYPDGTPTAYWPVGAPALYALAMLVFGKSGNAIAMINIVLGLGIVYLTFSIANQYFGASTAVKSAWIMALWPLFIEYTSIIGTEIPFILFLLVAIQVWSRPTNNRILKTAVWSTSLAIATYIRPTALPLFALLPLIEYICERSMIQLLKNLLLSFAIASTLISPWALRNQRIFGSPILVSANFGGNLWMGNNPNSDGGYMPLPENRSNDELTADRMFKSEAMEYITHHPYEYVKLAINRTIKTFSRETIGIAWNEQGLPQNSPKLILLLKSLSTIYWIIAFGLSFAGIYFTIKLKLSSQTVPLLIISAYFIAIPILTVGQDRYHIPVNPFIAMFAALALQIYFGRKNDSVARK